MTFLIVTHVEHKKVVNQYWGYAPYVREMNIWFKHINKVIVVAPLSQEEKTPIDQFYQHENINFYEVKAFNIKSMVLIFKTLFPIPKIFYTIFKAMHQADHIHLRCPGNMGLIGCIVQIFFPKKKKSAKYAGNWDPNAKQPWSYRLQKWILSNTFLTKNMQVLVYGEWPNQTKNIKPFFTATYNESEIRNFKLEIKNDELEIRNYKLQNLDNIQTSDNIQYTTKIKCLFVGTLSPGKRPLYSIQLVEKLRQKGLDIMLDLLGEGQDRKALENYIQSKQLQDFIFLKGNQDKESTKQAYQESHLMLLPSKSEGWPKAVAEAMFWGCVPVVTPVSCVPYMIGHGKRGLSLTLDLEHDTSQLITLVQDQQRFENLKINGKKWSQQYTLDKFEAEIIKILNS